MRKSSIFFPLAAVLLAGGILLSLSGCQLDEGLDGGLRRTFKRLTIKATYENPDYETKTVLHDDGHVYWTPGDAISLFYGSGSGGGSKFVAQATEETRVTNFSGEIGVVTGGDEISEDDTYFWGLYPYDATAVCDGQTITVRVADSQIGAPDTFSPGCAPSLGHDQGLMLSFRNLYTGLWFTVTETGYRSVTIRANNGELIAGRAKYGFGSDGLPEVKEILEGTSSVTVTAPTTAGFEVGKKYYLLFFPQTLEGGFTLELNSVSRQGRFKVNSRVPFRRNAISSVVRLDTKCTEFVALDVTPDMIEDANFSTYLFNNYDSNRDGILSPAECAAVTGISLRVTDYDIASMQGIEFFPNLQTLRCYGTRTWNSSQGGYVINGKLTSLDVSHNKKLEDLRFYYNKVTSIDLSQNTALKHLDSGSNPLGSLDVSSCTALEYLNCFDNSLTSLNVSQNTNLVNLYCDQNQLTQLDVSNCTALQNLRCYTNALTSLDLSHNTALIYLNCQSNQLTSLDISHNTELGSLYYGYNPFSEPVVFSGNTKIYDLGCGGLSLTSLDVSMLPELRYLNCYNNRIESLDLTHNPALTDLSCYRNNISSLILSGNPALRYIDCETNPLTSLDFSANPEMETISCYKCQLASLDVTQCPKLVTLYCYTNQLTTLDITNNPMLVYLDCSNNPLQTIYLVSGQSFQQYNIPSGVQEVFSTALGIAIDEEHFPDANFRNYVASNLDNGDGILTDIEREIVSEISVNTDNIISVKGIELFPNLTYLSVCGSSRTWNESQQVYICSGQLASLDLSGNPKLESLYCYYNQLTALNLSANTALKYLYCYGNAIATLDLSVTPLLESVNVSYNALTAMDFSHNPEITWLRCDNNLISDVSFAGLSKLTMLNCSNNRLGGLDISDCVALKTLYCYGNSLTSLNLRYNRNLGSLSCYSNQLSSIDLSRNTALYYISCGTNQLTTLDLSLNTALLQLYCSSNQLTSIDVSHNTVLQEINCSYNNLSSINLAANTALTYVYFRANYNLTSVVLPQTIVEIAGYAFQDCQALSEIDIPSSVAFMGYRAFYNCASLVKVTMNGTIPPAADVTMFNRTNSNLRIFVPAESVAAYKAADGWSQYADRISIPAAADNEDITYITW